MARRAADEVARAGRRERDLGVLVAVGLDGVAGRARVEVRGAHLRHRVHHAVLEHCMHACTLSASAVTLTTVKSVFTCLESHNAIHKL